MNSLESSGFKWLLPKPVSPTYDKAVKELADILYGDQPLDVKKKYLHEFGEKFTTNILFWRSWQRVQEEEFNKNGIITEEIKEKLEQEVSENFMTHKPFINCLKHIHRRSSNDNNLRCQDFGWVILKDLVDNIFLYEPSIKGTLPHSIYDAEFSFLWYQINITKFSSYKNLNKIEKYVPICAEFHKTSHDQNIIKWIKAFSKKVSSPESMIKTIEMRFDETCKKEWKQYFYFARKYNEEKFLDVYRRYCRTFVDDLKMRKKYRKEIKSAGKKPYFDNTKWILDSIKLEYDFGSKVKANELIKEYVENNLDNGINLTNDFNQNFKKLIETAVAKNQKANLEDSRTAENYFLETPFICCKPFGNIKYNKKNMIFQEFSSFPKTLLYYIPKNASYGVTQKLQYSSKQMYLWTNLILCMKVSITDLEKTEAHDEALFISGRSDYSIIANIQKLFIFNTLYVNYEIANDILSKFIPKISKCFVKYLIICSQILTMDEYTFLTNSKNVKGITLKDAVVKNICGNRASLEELMKNLPNLENLKINPSPLISYETFETIENYERKVKIKSFSIEQIILKFDPNQFCNFLKNNFERNFDVYMLHNHLNDCEYLKTAIENNFNLSELEAANGQSFYIKFHENLAFGTRNPPWDW